MLAGNLFQSFGAITEKACITHAFRFDQRKRRKGRGRD